MFPVFADLKVLRQVASKVFDKVVFLGANALDAPKLNTLYTEKTKVYLYAFKKYSRGFTSVEV